MVEDIKQKHMVTKIQLTMAMILTLLFSVTTATYAYFAFSATNNIIGGSAATVNLTLDVTKIFPTVSNDNAGKMVPQLSISGNANSPLAAALKNGCVDTNQNIVCQVYKINIQNVGGTATQVVDGWISFFGDVAMTTDVSTVMPSLRWKLIDSVNVTTPSSSVLGDNIDLIANAEENVFANDIVMPINSSFDYYMIVWINETNQEQPTDPGKSFYGKVEFNSANGTGVTSTFTP